MAFKRLVVRRSPMLVWSGVLASVFWFAWMRAENTKTFAQLVERMAHGDGWIWALGYAVFAYLVFRGLYGAWWRELKIDRDARTLKTCLGEVVPLAGVGALKIDGGALTAENVETPLFRGARDDVKERHDALAYVLRRATGRPQLYRLRRLAYHRSWGLFAFTLVGFAVLSIATGSFILTGESPELEYKLMALGGYAVCFAWFRRALFGSFSRDQLFVDPTLGVLRLRDGSTRALTELGELSIAERRPKYDFRRRHQFVDYELRAAAVEGVLYSSVYKGEVQLRLDALQTAILQHALRRALEAPDVEGDAFRRGIDPQQEAARIAGDSPHRRAAFEALTHDPDPTVRERASQLLRSVTAHGATGREIGP